MPCAPPVTIATLPCTLMILSSVRQRGRFYSTEGAAGQPSSMSGSTTATERDDRLATSLPPIT
jgi:hypothetical protein